MRRLLLVHAHPDDETITTGATIARYVDEGVGVTVLTCTLGEQGEILVPRYEQLAAERADQLGGLRIGELDAALRALGVTDHRFLGGAGRFRDSGMMGSDAIRHPRAFWRAEADPAVFAEAVAGVVAVIRDVRPQVVVTYDPDGDYGHPDHVMAHRVTAAAVEATFDIVRKFYWTATPSSELVRGYDDYRRVQGPFAVADVPAWGVADDMITTVIDASPYVEQKRTALQAHATQVIVDGDFFALSNLLARRLTGVEHYRRVGHPPDAIEDDLFAGVTT